MTAVLDISDLRFRWPRAERDCLQLPRLSVAPGECVFLRGPSGSGKSTLLSLAAGVVLASEGRVACLGADWRGLRNSQRDHFRATHLGVIFQQFNLLPYLSALDNVLLTTVFAPARRARAHPSPDAAARQLLAELDLARTLWRQPAGTLSVGQQQRVAAARALLGQPELILADEPTSALDDRLRDRFLDHLLACCRHAGSALLLASHDLSMATRFDRLIALPCATHATEPDT